MKLHFKSNVALIVCLLLTTLKTLHAQEHKPIGQVHNPPVNVEGLFGNRGMAYQLLVIKKFQSAPKFGFFSITNMVAEWEKSPVEDMMSQAKLTYSIIKGLDVSAGFIYVPHLGFRPSANLVISKASEDYTFVAAPRIDLSKDATAETMLLAVYKPALNDKWRLYTRLQGLYVLMTNSGDHARSFVNARTGLKYKEFAFGAGANFDWYGPAKLYKHNVGGFLNIDLF